MINVAIIDDHTLITAGLEAVINRSGVATVVGHAATIVESEILLETHPELDVVLLDISMPEGNSLDYVEAWKDRYPDIRILMLTTYAEAAVVKRAMSCGADGYLLKSVKEEELIKGIQAVASGDTFICAEARQLLREKPVFNSVELTPREREVLKLIVEGLSIKMIADRLNLSFETVHSYFKYLKLKLGVQNTAALVRVAIEQKLI